MIDTKDRGFLLGDGVFETLLVIDGKALWLEEHLDRMEKAARKLGLPFGREEIENRILETLSGAEDRVQVMRVTLSRGVTGRGLPAEAEKVTITVSSDRFDHTMIGKPIKLATSTVRRNPSSFSDRNKTLSYVNNVVAAREAKARGADDALMLNIDGLVACTTIANIFMIKGTALITPAEGDGILAGIVRRFLLDNAGSIGFETEVRGIDRDELDDADAVFICNSLRLVSPVIAIDGNDLRKASVSVFMDAILADVKRQCGANLMEIPR